MNEKDFRRSVSTDTAPRGSLCEWCGQPAISLLTAIGGSAHNNSGLFCQPCGEQFAQTVAQASTAAPTTSYKARL